jgi:hypothetical protein
MFPSKVLMSSSLYFRIVIVLNVWRMISILILILSLAMMTCDLDGDKESFYLVA